MERTTQIVRRVISRFISGMPMILRNVPRGHDWGWFSNEEPRMHLQTKGFRTAGPYKVFLEERGKRVFKPVKASSSNLFKDMPGRVQRGLKARVHVTRSYIEERWSLLMISKGWLRIKSVSLPMVTLAVYPGYPTGFDRKVDLRKHMVRLPTDPRDISIDEEIGSLTVWAGEPKEFSIALGDVIWKD